MAAKSSGKSLSGKGGGKGQYHDAKTGQFVTPGYAKKHPGTTFKESPRKK